jgi:hypothetical protein
VARPIAFKRLPRLRWKPRADALVPPDVQRKYPAFASDFAILDEELMPRFYELDNEALRAQNQFRLEQLVLIIGSAIAAILGGLQGAFTNTPWPGLIEGLLAVVLTVVAVRTRELRAQRRYLVSRVKAERLRSEYFLFLGRVGDYADSERRSRRLAERVVEVYRQKDQP